MTPDQNQRGDAAQRTSARRMTWTFIFITIVMSGLTLTLPYVVHRLRAAPAHEAVQPSPRNVPAP